MSGVEVAGLVLGAIPLVISALENYENVLDPTIAFMKYRGELYRARRELGNHHASFEQTMELLLKPITEPEELSDMIENTDSPHWTDPDIDQELQNKLGKAYKAYLRKTQDIQAIIIELAACLNIAGTSKVSQDGLEALISAHPPAKQQGKLHTFEFGERVRFTMKRQKIKKNLDELRSSIEMLDQYYSKAERLEEPYKLTARPKFASPLSVISKNAARLYNVLSKSWCSAHHSHSAGLLLEQRLVKKRPRGAAASLQKSHDTDCGEDKCFGISLLQSPLPQWLDVEFRLVEDYKSGQQVSSAVKFMVSAPDGSSNKAIPKTMPYADPSALQIVTDICSAVQQPAYPWIGFCVDDSNYLRGVYPASSRCSVYFRSGISLSDILSSQPTLINQSVKYTLSITLISSLLQLSHTPWLGSTWNKADIIFLRGKQGSSNVDVQYPYLIREHDPNHDPNRGLRSDGSKLLALGVMLLEICYRQSIERHIQAEDLGPNGQSTELSRLSAARRWLFERENEGDISFAFRTAISYCLKCYMEPTANLDNDEFARSVQEQVLAPLEDEMNTLISGPSTGHVSRP